jgi:hypothetical protein
MFLHFIGSTEIAFILAKWILPTLLTDFQTLKDRQFSLCHFSYIHNLQNKRYSFRINNEIPNYKIRLCAKLWSIWVRIRVLVGFISFILSNFVFTFFVAVLWCPLEVFDFWVNTIFGYFTPIGFYSYFIYVFGKYLSLHANFFRPLIAYLSEPYCTIPKRKNIFYGIT